MIDGNAAGSVVASAMKQNRVDEVFEERGPLSGHLSVTRLMIDRTAMLNQRLYETISSLDVTAVPDDLGNPPDPSQEAVPSSGLISDFNAANARLDQLLADANRLAEVMQRLVS